MRLSICRIHRLLELYFSEYGYPPIYLDMATNSRFPDPDFKVEVLDPDHLPANLRLILLRSIISSIPVATLGLVTASRFFTSEGYLSDQKVDTMAFLQLMASLTSVEILATNTTSLMEFTNLGIGNSTLPSLRTLTMMGSLSRDQKNMLSTRSFFFSAITG